MSKSSKRWLQEHNRDPFVNLARSRQLRSRAVFKLEELDRRYNLFRPGQTVVDLGAAPGSWSGYVSEKVRPGGRVIAIDLLEMQPLANVTSYKEILPTRNTCKTALPNCENSRLAL